MRASLKRWLPSTPTQFWCYFGFIALWVAALWRWAVNGFHGGTVGLLERLHELAQQVGSIVAGLILIVLIAPFGVAALAFMYGVVLVIGIAIASLRSLLTRA